MQERAVKVQGAEDEYLLGSGNVKLEIFSKGESFAENVLSIIVGPKDDIHAHGFVNIDGKYHIVLSDQNPVVEAGEYQAMLCSRCGVIYRDGLGERMGTTKRVFDEEFDVLVLAQPRGKLFHLVPKYAFFVKTGNSSVN